MKKARSAAEVAVDAIEGQLPINKKKNKSKRKKNSNAGLLDISSQGSSSKKAWIGRPVNAPSHTTVFPSEEINAESEVRFNYSFPIPF